MKNIDKIKNMTIDELAIFLNDMMCQVENNLTEKTLITAEDYIEEYKKFLKENSKG